MRPLLNAIKYCTSFPVIYVSHLLLHPTAPSPLHRLWLVLITLNTGYSLVWDVLVDWDLGQRKTLGAKARHPGLRPVLLFSRLHAQLGLYYWVIALDAACRASWAIRIAASSYVAQHPALSAFFAADRVVFLLQLVEICRRFVWLVFRIESHHVQQARSAG